MPLTFPSRSRLHLAARQAIAFIADGGVMTVMCVISAETLTRHFAASGDTTAQVFDRNRPLIEEAASLCFDLNGCDGRGELIVTEVDLARAETSRFDLHAAATHFASKLAHNDLLLEEAIYRLVFCYRH